MKKIILLIGIAMFLLLISGCLDYEIVKSNCIETSPEEGLYCDCIAIRSNGFASVDTAYLRECDVYLTRGR